MDAKLRIVGGQANKSEIKLKLPMTIGRNPGLGLTVNHNMVSRLHCQIYEKDGCLVVRDNNSSNGTQINDDYISEAVLKPGDRLTVGPLTFVAIYEHDGEFPDIDRPNRGPIVPPAVRAKREAEAKAAKSGKPLPPTEDPWGPAEESGAPNPLAELDAEDRTMSWNTVAKGSPDTPLMGLLGEDPPSDVVSKPAPSADFLLKLRFEEGCDLEEGTPVRAAGVSAGEVIGMDFVEEDGKLLAEATLKITPKLAKHLKDDMKVAVITHNGKLLVDISKPGSSAGNALESGHIILVGSKPAPSKPAPSQPPPPKAKPTPPPAEPAFVPPSRGAEKPFSIEDLLIGEDSVDPGSGDDEDMDVLDSPSEHEFASQNAPPERKTSDVGAFFEALAEGLDDLDEDGSNDGSGDKDVNSILEDSKANPSRIPKRPNESDLMLGEPLVRSTPDALGSEEELEEEEVVEELDELLELDELVDESSATRKGATGQNGASGKQAERDVSFDDFTFDDFAGDDVSHR